MTITPELALVDPDLASRARPFLHEPGRFLPDIAQGPATSAPAAPSRDARPVAPGVGHRLRTVRPLAVLLAALVAVCLATTGGAPSSRGAAGQAAPRVVAWGGHRSVVDNPVRSPGYRWPRVPGAVSYRVELLTKGRVLLVTTTKTPTFPFPSTLHLDPGRYTLSATPVREQADPRIARPVMETSFDVR
jgi:hypothetical protein